MTTTLASAWSAQSSSVSSTVVVVVPLAGVVDEAVNGVASPVTVDVAAVVDLLLLFFLGVRTVDAPVRTFFAPLLAVAPPVLARLLLDVPVVAAVLTMAAATSSLSSISAGCCGGIE